MSNSLTLIIPYYNQPEMLKRQIEEIAVYSRDLKVIVVDDGSPIKARKYIPRWKQLSLYRIEVDVQWNREMARNLGAYVADTEWIIQIDIDHILPTESVDKLLECKLNPAKWYRFPRFRVGKADSTRKKDDIPDAQTFGEIKPHVDSFLITRESFLKSPYNEEVYSGCLGGGTPFTSRMKTILGEPEILSKDICLHVHTKDSIKDASITGLSRDTSEYSKRRALDGDSQPKRILLQPWSKVNL